MKRELFTINVMKDFLIGLGIGFAVGAVMVKSNKDLSKAVDKTKKVVEEKVDLGKNFIEDNIVKPKKQTTKKQEK